MELTDTVDNNIEILINFNNQAYPIVIDKESSFLKLREAIEKVLEMTDTKSFQVYSGNYYLNELFDGIPIKKLNALFFSNKYNVLKENQNDPFNFFKANKNLNDFLEYHQDKIQKYMEVKEIESKTKIIYKDMSKIGVHPDNIIKDSLKEQNSLKPTGIPAKINHQSLKLLRGLKRLNAIEAILDSKFLRILELKNLENEAVELVKENKKLVFFNHDNSKIIEMKKKIIINLKNHRKNILNFRN